jgi:beta-phosphoglucomutase-like phosphatase (HAD superfamily)
MEMKEGSIKPALVVFDLGGTTVYDRGEVPTAFTDTLREVGIVLDPKELTTLRGASKYEALRHLLARRGRWQSTKASEGQAGRSQQLRRSLGDRPQND